MKLVIFDKDGTLTEPLGDTTFVQHPKDQKLRPGVAEKLAQLQAAGTRMAIASNQGGVAAGHKTLEEAIEEMKFAMELTGINTAFLCPDMAGEECYWLDRERPDAPIEVRNLRDKGETDGLNCRKPAPGMLIVARSFVMWREEDFLKSDGLQRWKPDRCLMVGDRPEDEVAALAADMTFAWADNYFAS